jgi:hypothetical protein
MRELVCLQILMDCEGVDAVDQVRSSPATRAVAGACIWRGMQPQHTVEHGLSCMQAQHRG